MKVGDRVVYKSFGSIEYGIITKIVDDNAFVRYEGEFNSKCTKMSDLQVSVKPRVKLVNEDGNIYNLVGIVQRSLKAAGQDEEAVQAWVEVQECKSYEDALCVLMKYVEVE